MQLWPHFNTQGAAPSEQFPSTGCVWHFCFDRTWQELTDIFLAASTAHVPRTGVYTEMVKGAVEVRQVGGNIHFEQPPRAKIGKILDLLQKRQHLRPQPLQIVPQRHSRHSHQRLHTHPQEHVPYE